MNTILRRELEPFLKIGPTAPMPRGKFVFIMDTRQEKIRVIRWKIAWKIAA